MGLEADLILSWLTLLVHLVRSVEPKTLINPQNITHLEIPELLFLWREVCNAVQPFLPISNSWAFADNRLLCFPGQPLTNIIIVCVQAAVFAVRAGESDGGDHGPTLNLPEVYCFRYLYFSFNVYYVIEKVDQAD